MSRLRRFSVPVIPLTALPAEIRLPPEEGHHVRVLRLELGARIELGDAQGRLARGAISSLGADGVSVRVDELLERVIQGGPRLIVATAWPKGKRAAVLVEKCAELGASAIVPLHFVRSVVSKDDESEGLVRLRRIAAEASKQCRRPDVLSIEAEQSFKEFLSAQAPITEMALLDPHGELSLSEWGGARARDGIENITLIVGPEGGFAPEELDLIERGGISRVRLATNVLRIETAALAACAVMASLSLGCPNVAGLEKEKGNRPV